MILRRPIASTILILTVLALAATACGGGGQRPVDPGIGASSSETGAGAIPPTATSQPDGTPAEATAQVGSVDEPSAVVGQSEVADPWQVTVLSVNDDVQIVPVFDAPNGNNITLYDVNEIDGVELEYPLYAQTAFGNRLALVVERFDDSGAWAEVLVPVRPNGTTAWVQTAFFSRSTHDYRITIDLSENKVNVYKGDELLIEQIAVSGRETRPTPLVRAYIDEKIPGATLSPAYGSWVLSIAAFSESLGTFGGGGMPKLALHGTNQPELMGQYVSSGCVRVPNEVIEFIAETVPVGTRVDIVA